ncbi:MAG: hypothetical protein JRF60_09275 [Deltaproteobacteria bacterium]|jgi:hypothetical protein|nr:hypothetical protein [Deltaproteobacteria bacterium]MBW2710724.1 hypothetical protein [Deltaproteobacteria bacterium]
MKNKMSIITGIIVVSLIIGIAAYALGPGEGSRGSYGMGGSNYGMIGGHGMMGGYGSGHGMMDGYGQDNPNFKAEMEALIDQIEDKRRELDPLLGSGNPDKALINRKVEELNNLERYLDERISSGY